MAIMSVLVDPNNGSANKPNLTLLLASGVVFAVYETREDLAPDQDFASPGSPSGEVPKEIEWAYETGYTPNNAGELNTFHALGLRIALKRYEPVTGDRTVNVTVTPLDTTTSGTPNNTLTVESAPAKMYNLPAGDIVSEKVRVKLSGKNAVFLSKLILFVSERIKLRPRA